MRKIKLLFLAGAVFFVAIVAVATAVPQLTPLAPTFQVRTRLVQVDVIVRNKNGPVMMLNQDDFTLRDNGKPQKISVFAVKGTPSSRQRYREAYFASKAATDADRHLTLDQLLRDTLDAAEIGLRAETKPDLARPGSYKLRTTRSSPVGAGKSTETSTTIPVSSAAASWSSGIAIFRVIL